KKSEALLSGLKRSDGAPGIDGIFTPNESTTLAMLRVLEDNGWAGKVKFVGFDASDTLVKGLADAHIDGLVLQDPVNMGYLGVKTMAAHLRHEPVQARVDTGVRLVTREQMNDPEARGLLHPDLSKWLKPETRRASRCSASGRHSAPPWRSTASTSPCAAGMSARSSDRTAPERAR